MAISEINFFFNFSILLAAPGNRTKNKGIVLKIGVQNSLESALTILLSSRTLKTLIFAQMIIRELY